jgi:hypothetical protein
LTGTSVRPVQASIRPPITSRPQNMASCVTAAPSG